MQAEKKGFQSVDEYIATFPEDVRASLEAIRATIKASAPGAEERISYQMPSFHLNGYLVYYAAWKKHIAFYPASGGVTEAFKDELAKYDIEKGTVRFSLNEPVPLELISKIVQFRVAENLGKPKARARKKEA
jgi:uncharacterized protein YdhG (YjbR/CyaY superfamily)